MSDPTVDQINAEWTERALRIAHERVALALATGGEQWRRGPGRVMDDRDRDLVVTADPREPDDNNPLEARRYYVDVAELRHASETHDLGGRSAGFVTGVKYTRYEIKLQRIGEAPDETPGG